MFEGINEKKKRKFLNIVAEMEVDGKHPFDVLFDENHFYLQYFWPDLDVKDFMYFENYIEEFIDKYPEKLEEYFNKYPQKKKIYELKKLNKQQKIEVNQFHKIDPSSIKSRKTFNFEWQEITPYSILGIEEKEYTEEELLEIIVKKINFIKEHGIDKEEMQRNIDSILDAYNELTKTSSKKR